MAVGNTFVVEKVCPICGQTTRVVKYRSRIMALTTDCDFCTHYKDFNPYFYTIWVCEHCAYAADEKTFTSPMPERHKHKIQEFLAQRRAKFDFHDVRTLPEAVATFKLAIFYEELLNTSLGHRAGLYLELAWIYRTSGDKERELPMLQKAADLYEQSILTERYPIGNLTDTMAIYLTGAICYLMNDYDRSTNFLSRLISDQMLRTTDPRLYEKARYLWQDVRTAKEAADKEAAKQEAEGGQKTEG